jgi:hypothetical protein
MGVLLAVMLDGSFTPTGCRSALGRTNELEGGLDDPGFPDGGEKY